MTDLRTSEAEKQAQAEIGYRKVVDLSPSFVESQTKQRSEFPGNTFGGLTNEPLASSTLLASLSKLDLSSERATSPRRAYTSGAYARGAWKAAYVIDEEDE